MLRISIIWLTITSPLFVFGYTFLQPLPGFGPSQSGWQGPLQEGLFSTYLSWLFGFMLAAAAFLAVVQIVIGGIQMMIGGASETQRSSAKNRIQDAIYGLLLALASWLILYTINPDLAAMKLTIPEIKIATTISVPPPAACLNCTSLDLPSANIKPTACSGPCQINTALLVKLKALSNINQEWWVTEGYPPTVQHKDSCHQNGTCVDIALKGALDCNKVKKLIQDTQSYGFSVTNEYASCGGKTYDTTTGNCLHIKLFAY